MDTMFILGQYVFGLSTAAPNELARDTTYNWPAQEVFGAGQALQFTGWGEESITLNGVIYPEFISSTGQLDAMRDTANLAEPLLLIDGRGNILGEWVIKRIGERQDAFAMAGAPLRQHFSMSLVRYGGNDVVWNTGGAGVSALEQLRGQGATSGLAGLMGMISGGIQAGGIAAAAFQTASDVLATIGTARDALTLVQTGMNAAKDLQSAAKAAKNAVDAIKSVDSLDSAVGALNGLIYTAGTASGTAARSGTTLLGLVNTVPQSVRGVVQAAGYAGNQLSSTAAKISAGVQKTVGDFGL